MSVQLSPLDAQELTGLRALLREALSASQKTSPVYRIFGVVMLDACNERAMNIAVRPVGVDFTDFQNFDGMKSRLSGHFGDSWKPQQWRDVLRLHNARNLAQHHSIPSSVEPLPIWRAATEGFVSSLVRATFGVSLAEVRFADAINDSELREYLGTAERHLSRGELAKAQTAAYEAYDEAKQRWTRATRESRLLPLRPMSKEQPRDRWGKWVTQTIETIEATNQDVRFAGDSSDLHWFLRSRREGRGLLNEQETDRLLGFVFFCLVEWDAVAGDLSLNWRDRRAVAARNVRTGDEPAAADDVNVMPSTTYAGDQITERHYELSIPLRNVPPEDQFALWGHVLVRTVRELGLFQRVGLNGDGTLKLDMAQDLDSLKSTFTAIHGAIHEAEGRLKQEIQRRQAEDIALEDERERYARSIASASLPAWIIQMECVFDPREKSNVIAVTTRPELDRGDLDPLLRELPFPVRHLSHVRTLVVPPPLPPFEDLIVRLEGITPVAQMVIDTRLSVHDELDKDRQSLRATFRAAMENARAESSD